MADTTTPVNGSATDYAECLISVLPLFASNLPCFDYSSGQRDYYLTDEHELRNHLSYIQFEIRLLHVTLTHAKAELGAADAFKGCEHALRRHMDTLDSFLRPNTVKYISSLLPSVEKKPEKTWFTALSKPLRLLDFFSKSSLTNQARSVQNFHIKLYTLRTFLEQFKKQTVDRSPSSGEDVYESDHHSQEDTSRLVLEDIYDLIKLPPSLKTLEEKLKSITHSNKLLELTLSDRIPSFQRDSKSQKRRQRRMQDPQYRARELGENFCKALACNCSNGPHPHKASLRLTPYWCHDPSSSHGSVSFDVLLSTLSEPSKWEETMFIADERDNTPSGCSHVEDFCDFIRKLHLTASTPYIILHKDRFFKTKSSRAKQCNGFEPTLSLKSLLDAGFFEPGPNKFQIRTKRILAVVLAHHLLQFAETTLLSNNWNSQNVFFLRRVQDDIPADIHKLFFLTGIDKHNPGGDNEANIDGTSEDNLGGEISKTVGEHAFYRHPSLISLGILLLEMETGKTMQADKEYCDPKTGQKNINTMWTTAGKLLKSPEIQESVYQDFRSVIEVCLEPKKFLPDGLGFGDLKFREKVYENIVAPLELELLDGWPDLDINSLGVSRDFSMHSQNAVEPLSFSQPLLRGNTKQSQKAVDANSAARVTEINGALAPGVLPTALPSILETSVEAGVDLPAVDSMNMRTLPWWKEFQHTLDFMAKHRTDSSTIHTGKRVKVAILDTGYDRFNQDLKDVAASLPSKIGWQDFVRNEKKPVDESESGHGSRVAYFLLQMTTNIDLWIARVYEKDEGIPESAISVKNAIDAAKDLEVDIICMSFGFEKRIDSIARSIEEANAKGILIFAAASNDRGLGSNSPTFPANMNHRVFCINSHTSDMNPKWSSFNPDFVPEQSNFCIIGEGLHGPQKTTTDGVRLKARKFVGTSYSTPIAAGTAALVLEYGRSCNDLQKWNHPNIGDGEREPLLRYETMRTVFKGMCYPKYYEDRPNKISPWKLLAHRDNHLPWKKIEAAIEETT